MANNNAQTFQILVEGNNESDDLPLSLVNIRQHKTSNAKICFNCCVGCITSPLKIWNFLITKLVRIQENSAVAIISQIFLFSIASTASRIITLLQNNIEISKHKYFNDQWFQIITMFMAMSIFGISSILKKLTPITFYSTKKSSQQTLHDTFSIGRQLQNAAVMIILYFMCATLDLGSTYGTFLALSQKRNAYTFFAVGTYVSNAISLLLLYRYQTRRTYIGFLGFVVIVIGCCFAAFQHKQVFLAVETIIVALAMFATTIMHIIEYIIIVEKNTDIPTFIGIKGFIGLVLSLIAGAVFNNAKTYVETIPAFISNWRMFGMMFSSTVLFMLVIAVLNTVVAQIIKGEQTYFACLLADIFRLTLLNLDGLFVGLVSPDIGSKLFNFNKFDVFTYISMALIQIGIGLYQIPKWLSENTKPPKKARLILTGKRKKGSTSIQTKTSSATTAHKSNLNRVH